MVLYVKGHSARQRLIMRSNNFSNIVSIGSTLSLQQYNGNISISEQQFESTSSYY